MIVVGIGCRRGSSPEAISQAVRATIAASGLSVTKIDALATAAFKKTDFEIEVAARSIGLHLHHVDNQTLAAQQPGCLSRSETVEQAVGVGSVCEAAALAVAGPDARLLIPKQIREGVTCALAQGGGQ